MFTWFKKLFAEVLADLRADLQVVDIRLKAAEAGLKTDLQGVIQKIEALEASLDARFNKIDSSLGFSLQSDLQAVKAEVEAVDKSIAMIRHFESQFEGSK